MKKTTFIIILLCVLIYGNSHAGIGSTGASFLNIGTSARATGMGGVFAGVSGDINTIHHNPSGLAGLAEKEFQAMHTEWISGMHYEFAAVAAPIELTIGDSMEMKGTAGLSLIYLSAGEIERRGLSGEKLDGAYGACDMAITLSYAQKLNSRMDLGMNFKIINQSIDNEKSRGFAIDLGNTFRTPVNGLLLGLAVKNIGPKMKFIEAGYSLPLTISLGGAYNINGTFNHVIGMDINYQPLTGKTQVSFGGEYNVNNMISLRTGYLFNLLNSGVSLLGNEGIMTITSGLSGGVGFNFPKYKIDYAFVPMGEFGSTHRMSFSTKF